MEQEVSEVKQLETLPPIKWVYTMRREMQEIVRGIYLGPYQSACKSQLQHLLDAGITHILCVRQNIEARSIRVNFPDNFVYKVIEFRDHPCESIICYFSEAKTFIDQCASEGGKVLVHGINGMSRSAAIVIAYIMERNNLNFDSALKIVRSRRYVVDPNYSFRAQLQEYEPIYQAKHMSEHWDENSNRINLKRRLSDDEGGMELG